jgi:hypothetical protein
MNIKTTSACDGRQVLHRRAYIRSQCCTRPNTTTQAWKRVSVKSASTASHGRKPSPAGNRDPLYPAVPYINEDIYPSNPLCMTPGSGDAGNRVPGTCRPGVAAGSCGGAGSGVACVATSDGGSEGGSGGGDGGEDGEGGSTGEEEAARRAEEREEMVVPKGIYRPYPYLLPFNIAL